MLMTEKERTNLKNQEEVKLKTRQNVKAERKVFFKKSIFQSLNHFKDFFTWYQHFLA